MLQKEEKISSHSLWATRYTRNILGRLLNTYSSLIGFSLDCNLINIDDGWEKTLIILEVRRSDLSVRRGNVSGSMMNIFQ